MPKLYTQLDRVKNILDKMDLFEDPNESNNPGLCKQIIGPKQTLLPVNPYKSSLEESMECVVFGIDMKKMAIYELKHIDNMSDTELKKQIIQSLKEIVMNMEDALDGYDKHIDKQ